MDYCHQADNVKQIAAIGERLTYPEIPKRIPLHLSTPILYLVVLVRVEKPTYSGLQTFYMVNIVTPLRTSVKIMDYFQVIQMVYLTKS